ncbi:NAD(P)/FAD-dependent oxidoreductase [Parapusillimonas granuli]|uniref:FAD-binding oxidoreductase n=1 Tax=Parapusillimonas granuli TaxID=380911 RepID=A0A853FZI3_9BURK|nr:FAD-binding oxidoreductase [Parapusillimonas granuli]MBB5216458.1 D-amino-acid dehydrogenase [Parapusillimonas granuli]NYT51525.1 FAD-binding oxidoreductase [Parapusillimonas granuli]
MKILVVGAGIIGALSALQLRRSGHAVTLIERDEPGMQCSYGNGGALSPDFCVPFALPGMMKRIPRWFADPNGPLFVDWRHLPKSLPWLFEWLRQSKLDKVWHNARAMRALHGPCIDLYESMLGEKAAGLIERGGSVYVWKTPKAGPTETLSRTIRETMGVQVVPLQGRQVQEIDPNLHPSYCNGLLFPNNGHTVNPLRLTQTIVDMFVAIGGAVIRDDVQGPVWKDGKVIGVQCSQGSNLAERMVIATGIRGKTFAAQLGDHVLLQAERGYHVMLPDPGVRPALKISNRDHMFGLAPMENGVRIGGTVEISDPDAPMRPERARSLLMHARAMYPDLNVEGAEFWMGSRPSTPDCLPIIGPSARAPNVLYAFGHGHSGVMASPMTAQLVTALINDAAPPVDPTPYRPDRF